MARKLLVALCAVLCTQTALLADGPDIEGINKAAGGALVRVMYHLQYADGETPSDMPGAGEALDEERRLVRPGYLLSGEVVLTEDLMIEDRFILSIEVEAGGGSYSAVPDMFSLTNRGLFLRLSSPVENAQPLKFAPEAEGPIFLVSAKTENGRRIISARPAGGPPALDETGRKVAFFKDTGLLVAADGTPVGVAMAKSLPKDGAWRGSPLDWPTIDAAEYGLAAETIRRAAAAGLVQIKVGFRARATRRYRQNRGGEGGPSEAETVGLLVEPGKILVFGELSRYLTARIETLSASVGESTVDLEIQGALKRYGAFLTTYDGELPGTAVLPLAEIDPADGIEHLFVTAHLDYDHYARREHFNRARLVDTKPGFRDFSWPRTTSDSLDNFLFTLRGGLLLVPLTIREPLQLDSYHNRESEVMMPAARLAAMLQDADKNIDSGFRPLSEEDSKRIAWLGVETQSLDVNLARAKNASIETKSGEIGAMISHVFEGSPADTAGVEPGDILLRFYLAGQAKPVDVTLPETRPIDFRWAELDRVPDMYFERLPRPWLPRDNELTRFLTEIGVGTTVTAVFISNGEKRSVDFTLEYSPPDFTTAARYENTQLGLTVKNLTYEVRRYFQMDESEPGVILADIEAGSIASVRGLKPCEIVTAVDSAPVGNVGDFEEALAAGGEVSLTVKRLSQSRVVQVAVEAPAGDDEGQ